MSSTIMPGDALPEQFIDHSSDQCKKLKIESNATELTNQAVHPSFENFDRNIPSNYIRLQHMQDQINKDQEVMQGSIKQQNLLIQQLAEAASKVNHRQPILATTTPPQLNLQLQEVIELNQGINDAFNGNLPLLRQIQELSNRLERELKTELKTHQKNIENLEKRIRDKSSMLSST